MTDTSVQTSSSRLPAAAHPGRARLRVADLERSLHFYRDLLGLTVVARDGSLVTLAAGEHADGADASAPPRELLVLREVPGIARRPLRPRATGLYHVAFLVPSRGALGRAIAGLRDSGYPLRGASDHAVSESLYLDDPDGNGLEIYADRPRSEWRFANGEVQLTTDPMDMAAVLAAGAERPGPWLGLPRETVVGHVHFTVSDLARAERFYTEVVGFDVMMRVPTLVAVSAGGYHHHINLNTWAGDGAPADSPDVAGLDAWELAVDDPTARRALVERLTAAGAGVTHEADGRTVARDPDGIALELRSS